MDGARAVCGVTTVKRRNGSRHGSVTRTLTEIRLERDVIYPAAARHSRRADTAGAKSCGGCVRDPGVRRRVSCRGMGSVACAPDYRTDTSRTASLSIRWYTPVALRGREVCSRAGGELHTPAHTSGCVGHCHSLVQQQRHPHAVLVRLCRRPPQRGLELLEVATRARAIDAAPKCAARRARQGELRLRPEQSKAVVAKQHLCRIPVLSPCI